MFVGTCQLRTGKLIQVRIPAERKRATPYAGRCCQARNFSGMMAPGMVRLKAPGMNLADRSVEIPTAPSALGKEEGVQVTALDTEM